MYIMDFSICFAPPIKKNKNGKRIYLHCLFRFVSFFSGYLGFIRKKSIKEMKWKEKIKNIQVWKITPILCKTFLFFFLLVWLSCCSCCFGIQEAKFFFSFFRFFPIHFIHSLSFLFVCRCLLPVSFLMFNDDDDDCYKKNKAFFSLWLPPGCIFY